MGEITDITGGVQLYNGVEMPYLGLGVYLAKEGREVINAVNWALDAGYRHIDTAAAYGNEEGVGEGIRQSGLPRKEVFLVSKVWNSDQGYDSCLRAFETSLKKLGTDYLDLYLIHWPVPGKYKETWRALEKLYEENQVRAIGLSNFLLPHLEDLLLEARVRPMVNQMEFHPFLIQQKLLDYCNSEHIQYEAWSPLMQGAVFRQPQILKLAAAYDKSPAQLVLRWDLQKGVVTIPKSTRKEHLLENADIFNFNIKAEDMAILDRLNRDKRFGPDPASFDF